MKWRQAGCGEECVGGEGPKVLGRQFQNCVPTAIAASAHDTARRPRALLLLLRARPCPPAAERSTHLDEERRGVGGSHLLKLGHQAAAGRAAGLQVVHHHQAVGRRLGDEPLVVGRRRRSHQVGGGGAPPGVVLLQLPLRLGLQRQLPAAGGAGGGRGGGVREGVEEGRPVRKWL